MFTNLVWIWTEVRDKISIRSLIVALRQSFRASQNQPSSFIFGPERIYG